MNNFEEDILRSQLKFERSEEKFKQLFELSPLGMVMVDYKTGRFLEVNDSLLKQTDYKREEFLKLSFWDITPNEYKEQELLRIEELRKNDSFGPNEKEYIRKDGSRYPVKISGFSIVNTNGKKVIWALVEDNTSQVQYEMIYEDNKNLLEYIAVENSLQKVLDKIVHLSELRLNKSMCSILLLDEKKEHLLNGSAPSLPDFYNEAINGIKIGEKVGSCGAAVFKKQRIIVEDINTHENWKDFLELTKKANLHACWSEPIISSNNKVLGTFAIYNKEKKAPNDFDLKLIEAYANIASKAIEKYEHTSYIKRSEYLLKNILSSVPDMIWLKDVEGKYLVCNEEFEKFFGEKEENIIGKTDYDFVNKDLADFFRYNDKKAMLSEKALLNEEWISYAGSTKKILLDTTKKALKDADGKILGVLGVGHDVTKRKEREDDLEQLNMLAQNLTNDQRVLLSLFDKAEAVLFKWKNNKNWDIDYVSLSAENLLGYSKEEFLEEKIHYSNCVHKEDVSRVYKEHKNAIEKGFEYFKHEPYRIKTKYSEEKWVLDYTVSQKNEKGKITHFISYITDITEYKKQQEIIFEQSKMISMAEMIGNIAHQWRQPLSYISTVATGAKLKKQNELLSDEEFYFDMEKISEKTQYLSKTIDDFRSFIQGEKHYAPFDMEGVLSLVLDMFNAEFINDNIEVIVKKEKNLNIISNANYMMQSLINILNNTKDILLGKDKNHRFIFIDVYKEKEDLIIKIKDSGGGIPSDIITRVFEPYITTKHQSLGVGLGLNVVYNFITEGMKGTVFVENCQYEYKDEIYQGAEFSLRLPLKQEF